jgi:hypothetical protein
MHLARYADQGSKFLQCIVTRMKHGLFTRYPKQKKSMTSKQPSFQTTKKFKATLYVKKVMTTVFWDHNGVFLAYFFDRRVTANVELCYNTHGRLLQAICLGDSAKA